MNSSPWKHLWKHSPAQTYFKPTCCSPVPVPSGRITCRDLSSLQKNENDNILVLERCPWPSDKSLISSLLLPLYDLYHYMISLWGEINKVCSLNPKEARLFPYSPLGGTMFLLPLCSRLLDWDRMPGEHAHVQLAEQESIRDIALTRPHISADTEQQSWLWAAWRQWWSPACPICQSIWSPNELLLITAI